MSHQEQELKSTSHDINIAISSYAIDISTDVADVEAREPLMVSNYKTPNSRVPFRYMVTCLSKDTDLRE